MVYFDRRGICVKWKNVKNHVTCLPQDLHRIKQLTKTNVDLPINSKSMILKKSALGTKS